MKDFYGNQVDTEELARFSQMVTKELTEMSKLGMRVPKRAIEIAKDTSSRDESAICNYLNMKTSECADLLISIAQIK